MNGMTAEWVVKAEGDFGSMNRELRVRTSPNHDLACFLAQQCAEKYLKACLQEAGIPFERTHNLSRLLDLMLPLEPSWEEARPDLQVLTLHAVEVRYPGTCADRTMARAAAAVCRQVRGRARKRLGLHGATRRKRSASTERRKGGGKRDSKGS